MIDIDNYEDKSENRYPCIYIDWITDSEKRYIQEQLSNYKNSLDELSDLNNSGENSDDLYSELREEHVEDSDFEGIFSEQDAGEFDVFDEAFDADFNLFDSDYPDVISSSEEQEDTFNDLFEDTLVEEDEEKVSLEELMSIVGEPPITEKSSDERVRDIFSSKLPIYVLDEKIAEAKLTNESLKILNHFFRRKWVLEKSETSNEIIDDTFLIKNVFNLI